MSGPDRSSPRSTVSRQPAGLPPAGGRPKTTAAPSTTSSPPPADDSSTSRPDSGSASPSPSSSLSRLPDMSLFSQLRTFTHNLTGRGDVERELDEELRRYPELLVAEKVNEGVSPEEARRFALAKVGGIEQVKEQVRDERPGMALENAARDLRYGLRLLRRW